MTITRVTRRLSRRSRAGRRVKGYSAYSVVRRGRHEGGISLRGLDARADADEVDEVDVVTAVGGGMEVRLSIRDVRNCRGFGMDEVII